MGKTHKLRDYLDEIKKIYLAANEDYAQLADVLTALDRQGVQISSDGKLTRTGKDESWEKLRETREKTTKQMEAIANEAKSKARAVRGEVEEDFYSLYNATGERLDMPTLELLKSGILTDRELMDLGVRFRDNPTMLRVLSKYAAEREGNIELRQLSALWQSASNNPHLQAVDAMISVCNYLVGDAPLSGPNGARTFAKSIDEITAPVYASAPAVGWKFADGSVEREYIRG